MTPKSLHVFRVYFKPGHRPFAAAEFEMVALSVPTATEALRLLSELGQLHGMRLVGWPDPDDRGTRLIDRIFPITLTTQTVESIRVSKTVCKIRPSASDAPAVEAAE